MNKRLLTIIIIIAALIAASSTFFFLATRPESDLLDPTRWGQNHISESNLVSVWHAHTRTGTDVGAIDQIEFRADNTFSQRLAADQSYRHGVWQLEGDTLKLGLFTEDYSPPYMGAYQARLKNNRLTILWHDSTGLARNAQYLRERQ
ncbi:hypothetical protein FWH13_03495 [Candidatus Saccharibacteria bacterium]|nr:hypothetical protein [Candidatus Saccharibacteria bacterium]